MPWYWTDDVAPVLVSSGRISDEIAATLIAMPVAHRREHLTLEEAARSLLDDGEIPLAA